MPGPSQVDPSQVNHTAAGPDDPVRIPGPDETQRPIVARMRPHLAAVVEEVVEHWLEAYLRERGWVERIIAYTGYGAPAGGRDVVRVLARVVLAEPGADDAEAAADATATDAELDQAQGKRGWRDFVTTPAGFARVTVTVGDASVTTSADRSGYVDVDLHGHGLATGWHEAHVASAGGGEVHADVRIMDPDARIGIVSDIDDTVLVTHLPRPLVAAWNTFVRSETAREAVPGMAGLAGSVLTRFPTAPVFYLSTGAWNVAPTLVRFLRRNGYPVGPLLLTDWGPTNTGWFRSGQAHKRRTLERLRREFPDVQWILVGDDGQHDPTIYREFARRHPTAVRAIAIRTLSAAEQVLSHGFPGPKEVEAHDAGDHDADGTWVPVLRGPDGNALRRVLALYDEAGLGDRPTDVARP